MIFLADWTFEQSMTFTGVIFSGVTGLLVIWLNSKLNKNTVETMAVKETVDTVKTQVDGQMTALKLAVEAAHAAGALEERRKHDAADAARNEGKLEAAAAAQVALPVQPPLSPQVAKVEVVNNPAAPVPVKTTK